MARLPAKSLPTMPFSAEQSPRLQWRVTVMKDQQTALQPTQPYFIATNDVWTPGTQPATQPPPMPGFIQIFGNPIRTQKITQPGGTEFDLVGAANLNGSPLCTPANNLCGGLVLT
jgi:hypothetical protein